MSIIYSSRIMEIYSGDKPFKASHHCPSKVAERMEWKNNRHLTVQFNFQSILLTFYNLAIVRRGRTEHQIMIPRFLGVSMQHSSMSCNLMVQSGRQCYFSLYLIHPPAVIVVMKCQYYSGVHWKVNDDFVNNFIEVSADEKMLILRQNREGTLPPLCYKYYCLQIRACADGLQTSPGEYCGQPRVTHFSELQLISQMP